MSESTFQLLPLADVVESALNPRRHFDEAKLAELAESVKAKGVLEPVLVRPAAKGWEVAAGARRVRAAKLAKLKDIPALVRPMSDAELLEVAILENVVRSDISALEEGEAYRQLVDQHGYTIEQLVEKTGKSRTIVFQRLKLATLEGPPRKLLEEGKLSASIAELIARLPTNRAREDALKRLEEKKHWKHEHLGVMPFREAKEILDEEFRLVLAKAPFDTRSTELLQTAGACTVCPKRTGADKELFPGVKADTCLDGACWKSKAAAATRELKAEMREHGKELVKINQLHDTYNREQLARPVAAKFDKPGQKVDGKHTWKELLGAEVPAVVALDAANKTHNLVDKKKALELLEAKDPKKAAAVKKAMEEPSDNDWRAKQEEARKKEVAGNLVAAYVQRQAIPLVKTEKQAVDLLLGSLSQTTWDWQNAMKHVGLPPDAKKLKPAQRPLAILGIALQHAHYESKGWLRGELARLAKADTKKLLKQALAAAKGTCFVCGCTEEKACDGGCSWVDEEVQTLCTSCAGDDE